MKKLALDMTPRECIIRLSGNYPGPLSVLARLQSDGTGGLEGHFDLYRLDNAEIYGPNIWVAYKDVCGEDLTVFRAALRDGTLRAQLEASPDYDPNW